MLIIHTKNWAKKWLIKYKSGVIVAFMVISVKKLVYFTSGTLVFTSPHKLKFNKSLQVFATSLQLVLTMAFCWVQFYESNLHMCTLQLSISIRYFLCGIDPKLKSIMKHPTHKLRFGDLHCLPHPQTKKLARMLPEKTLQIHNGVNFQFLSILPAGH